MRSTARTWRWWGAALVVPIAAALIGAVHWRNARDKQLTAPSSAPTLAIGSVRTPKQLTAAKEEHRRERRAQLSYTEKRYPPECRDATVRSVLGDDPSDPPGPTSRANVCVYGDRPAPPTADHNTLRWRAGKPDHLQDCTCEVNPKW